MKVFFDHCVSVRIVLAIRNLEGLPPYPPVKPNADLELEHVIERWPNLEVVDDIDWIPIIASESKILVSTDHAQRKKRGRTKEEAEALKRHAAKGFYLSKAYVNSGRWDQIWQFFKYWPNIEQKATMAKPGDIFDVSHNGRIDAKRLD